MSRPWKSWEKIVGAAAIAALISLLALVEYSNYAQLAANRMAEEYAARTEPLVSADPRFKNVVVYRFSGYGCARIHGWVSTQADLSALHAFIDATTPPKNIQVLWTVKVDPNPDTALREGFPFPDSTASASSPGATQP